MKITQIRKRDGRVVPFDEEKITSAIYKAISATGGRDRTLAEFLSKRVVEILDEKYGANIIPAVEDVQDVVERALVENGQARVAKAYIIYRQKRAEIRSEKQKVLEKDAIDEVDKAFDLNALRVLKARYLKKDETGKLIETPKQLFTRIAVHATLPDLFYDAEVYDVTKKQPPHADENFDPEQYHEKVSIGRYPLNRYHLQALKRMYDRFNRNGEARVSWSAFFDRLKSGRFNSVERRIHSFYELMVTRKFMPNTPAIANFGNVLGMGSACFVLGVEDSIESIMETLKQTAVVFKAGGGMGYNFSKLRPEGDYVSSTSGVASGPISFMMLFDTMTDVIKQGGCVSDDSFIKTDKGMLPIGALLNCRSFGENPTKYFVYDGCDYNHALVAMDNGVTKVSRIETELGMELKATFNHLVRTVDTEGNFVWKKVADLKPGDFLVAVVGGHNGIPVKLPQLAQLHWNSNPVRVPATMDEGLAELLGLYMADGCVSLGRFLFSSNAHDTETINRVKQLMRDEFGLESGEIRDKGTWIDTVFFSRPLADYFEAMEWLKQSSLQSFIPDIIMRSEKEVACAFLRGLFEGDGGMHPDGYPLLYSSSRRLLAQTQQLLLGLGMISRIYKCTDSAGRFGTNTIYRLAILTDRSIKIFRETVGFITSPKTAKVETAKKKEIEYSDQIPPIPKLFAAHYKYVGRGSGKGRSRRGADRKYYRAVQHYISDCRIPTRSNVLELMSRFPALKKDKRLQAITDERYFYTRITRITPDEAKTMEIEVPESGCYVANGLLVHNIRRGANMGILNSNHPDVEKFITAKKGNRALRNFNISVLVMPEFWESYKTNKPYPLINPRTGQVVREVNARLLFDMIVYQAWESAEPGVIFYDHVNEYNPFLKHLGPIVTTNPCVASDTLVSTSRGLERIDSIDGDEIAVDARALQNYLSTGQSTVQLGTILVRPELVCRTGIKPTYRVVTKSGYELVATADHRIMTEAGWKRVSELAPDDRLFIQSGRGTFNRDKKLPINVTNRITTRKGRTYSWNLPAEWSHELGLVTGWLIGDGWLNTHYNQTGWVFSGEDEEARRLLAPLIESYLGRRPTRIRVARNVIQLRSASKYVAKFFSDLGVRPVGNEREVPKSLFTATEDAVLGFLRALFSSDGTVLVADSSRFNVRLNSSSIRLLKDVQLLLLNLGIRSTIYDRSTKPKRFRYTTAHGRKKTYLTSGVNYELVISRESLVRFAEKVGFIQRRRMQLLNKIRGSYTRGPYADDFADPVKVVDYAGEREVWDISEPATHSFLASGIVVHNCGEVLLYPNESCNLGSINVWAFVKRDENGRATYDWEGLREAVSLGSRFLDNVIDVNNFPLKAIEDMTLATRKIGLGVMGLADLLFELRAPYNSDEGRKIMEELMEFVNYHSKLASIELAKERGPVPYFDKSFYPEGKLPFSAFHDRKSWRFDWDKVAEMIKQHGVRNGYTTVIAPTGSISMIAGCSSGIEPVYSLVFEKHVKVGSFYYIDPVFERVMTDEGLFGDDLLRDVNEHGGSIQRITYIPEDMKHVYVTAMDIRPEDHIRALAAFQRWTDSSISKTNNFPANATVEAMRESYLLAYKLGCKDVTVFRDTSIKGQVLVSPRKKQETTQTEPRTENEQVANPPKILAIPLAGGSQGLGEQLKVCPQCSSQVVYQEGCYICPECSWGACS